MNIYKYFQCVKYILFKQNIRLETGLRSNCFRGHKTEIENGIDPQGNWNLISDNEILGAMQCTN